MYLCLLFFLLLRTLLLLLYSLMLLLALLLGVVVGFVPAAEGIAVATDATYVDIKFLAWLLLLYGERR